MDLKNDMRPVSCIKTNAADMLRTVNGVTMLKLLNQSERDIEQGNVYQQESVLESVEQELAESKSKHR